LRNNEDLSGGKHTDRRGTLNGGKKNPLNQRQVLLKKGEEEGNTGATQEDKRGESAGVDGWPHHHRIAKVAPCRHYISHERRSLREKKTRGVGVKTKEEKIKGWEEVMW